MAAGSTVFRWFATAEICLGLFLVAGFDVYRNFDRMNDNFAGELYEVSLRSVAFVIRSQPTVYNIRRALLVKADIEQQCRMRGLDIQPTVVLTSEDFERIHGHWTILPLLPTLKKEMGKEFEWFFFCEEETRVSVTGLLKLLARHNPNKKLFLGRALRDHEATIIHHFRFHGDPASFSYPEFEAGWVLSAPLLNSLADRLENEEPKMDFSIDVKHELAYYIWREGEGHALQHEGSLCAGNLDRNGDWVSDYVLERALAGRGPDRDPLSPGDTCVTAHPKNTAQCGSPVDKDKVFFAVKTCVKFHKDRVPVVQSTWGRHAKHLVFFSEVTDPVIPTVSTGVPNTERGHCGKTFAILERFHSDAQLKSFDWLVIADDDTILSVARLLRLLRCYDPAEPLYLGERYGYGQATDYGYDYVTGGGGMVFSRPGVERLMGSGCRCNQIKDPDDMRLGACFKRLGVPTTHSPLFHQARPDDYAMDYLSHQTPVSFHKHWNNDPLAVYLDWFEGDDSQLRIYSRQNRSVLHRKDEL